jgi:hypothetical protein
LVVAFHVDWVVLLAMMMVGWTVADDLLVFVYRSVDEKDVELVVRLLGFELSGFRLLEIHSLELDSSDVHSLGFCLYDVDWSVPY